MMTGIAGAHAKINNFQQNKLTAMIRSQKFNLFQYIFNKNKHTQIDIVNKFPKIVKLIANNKIPIILVID